MNASDTLDQITERLKQEYGSTRRVMTFGEYMELFLANPGLHARSAAEYIVDGFEFFDSSEVESAVDTQRHWNLFDAPFEEGRDRLIGHAGVQDHIYRLLSNFRRQGTVNKLILLHGPNGSAKSSILACIARSMEAYSHTDEGAMYCFNWVFPTRAVSRKALGFGGGSGESGSASDSFAHLEEEELDATIPGELRDHPLLLIPKKERCELLDSVFGSSGESNRAHVSDILTHGDLAPRNRLIFDRLYNSYSGNWRDVLQHIQVERFFVSRRYRCGAVTVEPQLHVDASVRQLTGDRSLTSLPLALQNTTLFEAHGDLVDANRGVIEYNDLLKRPLDTFKYLLATAEKGSVTLPTQIMHLDLVLFASSNEVHLAAFKEYPDWPSFKARIELVRVPYLRCYRTEQKIYDDQVTSEQVQKRLAPHATFVAALWAVLTRLKKPNPERYEKNLRAVIASLTPIQKADLYADGKTPTGMTLEKARLLRTHIKALYDESVSESSYEGAMGASPREMKVALLNAAQRADYETVSPLAVLEEIADLVTRKNVYPFLNQEAQGQYRNHGEFVNVVKDRWLDLADDELHRAMGLVTSVQYDDLFKRYLTHVSHAGRGEKLFNELTGKFEDPDTVFMEELETRFSIKKDAKTFRSEVLGRIGAATSDGSKLEEKDYRELFPNLFAELENSYYQEQRQGIRKMATGLLKYLGDERDMLSSAEKRQGQETLDRMMSEFGYCEASTRETVATLISERYSN
jgi:predicted Ser/Thr protein kinase